MGTCEACGTGGSTFRNPYNAMAVELCADCNGFNAAHSKQEDRATKQARYTIAEIKRINQQAGHYFFSRDTMRFFGNTMKDFKVRTIVPFHWPDQVEVYVLACNHNAPVGADRMSVYRFTPETGDISKVDLSVSAVEHMRKHKIGADDYRYIARLTYEQS